MLFRSKNIVSSQMSKTVFLVSCLFAMLMFPFKEVNEKIFLCERPDSSNLHNYIHIDKFYGRHKKTLNG